MKKILHLIPQTAVYMLILIWLSGLIQYTYDLYYFVFISIFLGVFIFFIGESSQLPPVETGGL